MATVPDLSGTHGAEVDEHIPSERELLEDIVENTEPA